MSDSLHVMFGRSLYYQHLVSVRQYQQYPMHLCTTWQCCWPVSKPGIILCWHWDEFYSVTDSHLSWLNTSQHVWPVLWCTVKPGLQAPGGLLCVHHLWHYPFSSLPAGQEVHLPSNLLLCWPTLQSDRLWLATQPMPHLHGTHYRSCSHVSCTWNLFWHLRLVPLQSVQSAEGALVCKPSDGDWNVARLTSK